MFPFLKPPATSQEKLELAKIIANRGRQVPTQRPNPLVRPAGMPWLRENMDMATLGLGVLGAGAGFAAAPLVGVAGLPLAAGLAGLGVFAPQVADYFVNPAAPPTPLLPQETQDAPSQAPEYGLGRSRPYSFSPQGIFGEAPEFTNWSQTNPILQALGFPENLPDLKDEYTGWNPAKQLGEFSRRMAWQQQYGAERSAYENPAYEALAPNRVLNKIVRDYAGDLVAGIGTLPERLGGVWSRTSEMETKNPLSKAYGYLLGQNEDWTPNATSGHGLLMETLRTLEPEAQAITGFYTGVRGLMGFSQQPSSDEKALDFILAERQEDPGTRALKVAKYHTSGIWPDDIPKPSTVDYLGAHVSYNINNAQENFTKLPLGEQMFSLVAVPELASTLLPSVGIGSALRLAGKYQEATFKPSLSLLQDWNSVRTGVVKTAERFVQAELGGTFNATGLQKPSTIMDVINSGAIFTPRNATHSVRNWLVKKNMGVFDMTLDAKAQAMTEQGMEHFYELLKRGDNDNVGQLVQSMIDLGDWSPTDLPEAMSATQKAALKILEDIGMGSQTLTGDIAKFYGFKSGQVINNLTSTNGVLARKLLMNMAEGAVERARDGTIIEKTAEQIDRGTKKILDLIMKARLPIEEANRTPLLMTAAYDAQASLIKRTVSSALGLLGVEDVAKHVREQESTWVQWQRWYAKMWHIGPVPGVGIRNVMGDMTKLMLQDKEAFRADANYMKIWSEGLPTYLGMRGVEKSGKKTFAVREGFLTTDEKTPLWKKVGFESGSYFQQFTEEWLHNKVQAGAIQSFMDRFHRTKAMSLDYGDMSSVPPDLLKLIDNKLNKAITPGEIQSVFGDIYKGIHWTADEMLMDIINNLRANQSLNRDVGEEALRSLEEFKNDVLPDRFLEKINELITDEITRKFIQVESDIIVLDNWNVPVPERQGPYIQDGVQFDMTPLEHAVHHAYMNPDTDSAKAVVAELTARGVDPADFLRKGQDIQSVVDQKLTAFKRTEIDKIANVTKYQRQFTEGFQGTSSTDAKRISKIQTAYERWTAVRVKLQNLTEEFAEMLQEPYPKGREFYDLEAIKIYFGGKEITVADFLRDMFTQVSKEGKRKYLVGSKWLGEFVQTNGTLVLTKVPRKLVADDMLENIRNFGKAYSERVGQQSSLKRFKLGDQRSLSEAARGEIDRGQSRALQEYWIGMAELYKKFSGSDVNVEVFKAGGVPYTVYKKAGANVQYLAQEENAYAEAIKIVRDAIDEDNWIDVTAAIYRKLIPYNRRLANKPASATLGVFQGILQGLGVRRSEITKLLNLTLATDAITTPKGDKLWDVRQVIREAFDRKLTGRYVDGEFVNIDGTPSKTKTRKTGGSGLRYVHNVPEGAIRVDEVPQDWLASDMRNVSFVVFSDGALGKIQHWIDEDTFVYSTSDVMEAVGRSELKAPQLMVLEKARRGLDGNYRPAYKADWENYYNRQKRINEPLPQDTPASVTGPPGFAKKYEEGQIVFQEDEYQRILRSLPDIPSSIEAPPYYGELDPRQSLFTVDFNEELPRELFHASDNDWALYLKAEEASLDAARRARYAHPGANLKFEQKLIDDFGSTKEAIFLEHVGVLQNWQSVLMREYMAGVDLSPFQMKVMQGENVGSVITFQKGKFRMTASENWLAQADDIELARKQAKQNIEIPPLPTGDIEYIQATQAADIELDAQAQLAMESLATPGVTPFGADALQQASVTAVTNKASGQLELGVISETRNLDLDATVDQLNLELADRFNPIAKLAQQWERTQLPTYQAPRPPSRPLKTIKGLKPNKQGMPITSDVAGKDAVLVPNFGIYTPGSLSQEDLTAILERGIQPDTPDPAGGSTFRFHASKEQANFKKTAAKTEVAFMIRNTGNFRAGQRYLYSGSAVLPEDIFVIDPKFYGAKPLKPAFLKTIQDKGFKLIYPEDIVGSGITLVTERAIEDARSGPAQFGGRSVFVTGSAGNVGGEPHVTLLDFDESVPQSSIVYDVDETVVSAKNIAEDKFIEERYISLANTSSGVSQSVYRALRDFIYKFGESDKIVFAQYKDLHELMRNTTAQRLRKGVGEAVEIRDFSKKTVGEMSGLPIGSLEWKQGLMGGEIREFIDGHPELRAYLGRIDERKQQLVDKINSRGLRHELDQLSADDMPFWFADDEPTENQYVAMLDKRQQGPERFYAPTDMRFGDMDYEGTPDDYFAEYDAAVARPPDPDATMGPPDPNQPSIVDAFTRKQMRPAEVAQMKTNQTLAALQELYQRAAVVWGDNSQVSTATLSAEAIQQLQRLQAHKLERLTFARSVANRVAAATTDHLLYNYSRTYNFDSYMNHMFGYPFWYTRTFTDYPRQLLQDPNYLSKLYQWNKQINQINEDEKLPRWMRASIKAKVPDIFNLQDLMGTETMYLPMLAQLSPLEQLMNGQFTNAEREKNQLGQVYNRLYGWGPGPHALVPLALGTALFTAGKASGNEEWLNQAAQYFGYLGSQTRLITSVTAALEKASGAELPISGGINPDAAAMIYSAAGGLASPKGSFALKALMGLGGAVQFAITHTMTKDGVKFVGPVYDQRRVATVLSQWGNEPNKMVAGFSITPELLQDAAIVSKDPYLYGARTELAGGYAVWSAAVTEARSRKAIPDLITYLGGPGMSARGEGEIRQEEMYQTVQELFERRDDQSVTPEQYSEEWTKLSLKYPDFPIYGMFKRYGDKAFNVYAYSVISRVGKGATAKAVYNTVGLDYDIIGKFYDTKGQFTYGTEEAQLKEGIIRLGMLLKAPDAPTKTEWSNAGILFRKLQSEMETMYPGTSSKLDVFYNLEKDEQTQFLRDHLDLKARMETELAMTVQDPKYRNTLGPYYISIKDTRDFVKLVYMTKDPSRAKAYEIYLENSRDWPEQKEKQFLADFDLYGFHRGYEQMTSNLDNTIATLLEGIALPKLPTVREDAPDIEAKKSMINSLMQISQTAEQQARRSAAVTGGNVPSPDPVNGMAPPVVPGGAGVGAGVGGGAMPGMMSGDGTGTVRQENPSANLLEQWEYLYSQKQVSSVGYVQEYKDQLKYQTLQPLLDYFKGDTNAFLKALDTPILTAKWPTFSDPRQWENNLVQYVKMLGGENLRSAMTIEVSKGVPSDVNNMVWSKVIGTVRALSLAEIGRMSSQHPELRDLGIVREQSSTYSGPTFNGLLDTIGAAVSIQEDGSISVSGEKVKTKKKTGTGVSSTDIEEYVSKWAKEYYGENIEQLYENYIMVNVSQGSKAARSYWNKYPQLAKYQAFSATIWKRYGDVRNGLKEGFDDVGKIIKLLEKITPSVAKRGDKDSSGYEAFSAMLTRKSVVEQLPVQSLNLNKPIDGRLFANVIAVIKATNPSLAMTFTEFMQANPQKRQAMLQASPDLARYITQFTPEQLGNIETSYNKGLDIGGNSYGVGGGVRVYKERSGRTGL